MDCGIYFRIESNLSNPLTVSQVDKNQTAMVTAAMYPAHQGNLFAYIFRVQLSTVMASFSSSQWFSQTNLLLGMISNMHR
jgi:hypothetical protein